MPALTKSFLALSAGVLLIIGTMLGIFPETLYASSGASLPETLLLRSDLRAGGIVLLGAGVFVAWAAWRSSHARFALQLSALIYLGYGLGRVVSFTTDGTPNTALLVITGVEFAIGIGALTFLWLGQRHFSSPG